MGEVYRARDTALDRDVAIIPVPTPYVVVESSRLRSLGWTADRLEEEIAAVDVVHAI